MTIKQGDVDIDFANRDSAISLLQHVPASMIRDQQLIKHNTGIYFHSVPVDPITNLCSIDYKDAKNSNFFKFDLLNVHVYSMVRDEQHLIELMTKELNWELFQYPEFTQQLIHIARHSNLVRDLKPQSISDLSIVLALIRPGQRHLIDRGKLYGFSSIQDEIWSQPTDSDGYVFHQSHSVAYAHLVVVHANLLLDDLQKTAIINSELQQ